MTTLKMILLAVFVTLHFTSVWAAITDDLVGHWTFDETSGFTLGDRTSNANDGTLYNFPEDNSHWVPGKIGGSLQFGGPSSLDYVIVPDYPKPTTTMTISIWVWTDVRPSDWAMVINDWVGSCGQFHVGLFGGVDMANFTSPEPCGGTPAPTREGTPFPVGSWEHVAFVADGEMMRQYRNGQEVSSIPHDGTIYQPPVSSFGIGLKPNADGTGPGNTAWLWQGKMDDLGIWRRALNPQEIVAIYQAGLAGKDLAGADATPEPPRILTQPQGQNRYVGEGFSLSVRAGGTTPLTYQWSKDGQPLAGKTEATLVFVETTTEMSGSYKVEVRNAHGSIVSDAATVTVNPVINISTGLAGHWKLDETSGLTAADSTVPVNNGELAGYVGDDTQWVSSKVGGGLQFGGVDSETYVRVADYPKPPNGTITITAWVWNETQEGLTFAVTPQFIGSWGNTSAKQQFRIGLQGDRLTAVIRTSGGATVTATESASFDDGAWQHVALVADGAFLRIYRNGFEAATATYSRQLASPDGALTLSFGTLLNDDGTSPIAIPDAFLGKLDDVGLWGRALTSREILAIYQAGMASKNLSLASVSEVQDVKPTIVSEPQASTDKFVGEKFSLSVQAIGSAPLSYQWRKNNELIEGATRNTYSVDPASVNDSGTYTVVISNSAGSVTSAPAVVRVLAIEGVTTGLVGHWKFDDLQGKTLTDSTSNGNHGALGNFPDDNSQWVPGRINGSLAFRGPTDQDHVIVPDYPKPETTLSISIWVWTDVRPSDWAMVVNDWSGSCGQFHVGLFGGVDLANFMSTAGCVNLAHTRESKPFPVGSWEHVAFVADGEMLRQYHNGQETFKVAYDGTIFQPTVKSFGIGMKPNADGSGPGAFFWQGKMDDLGIWRRNLSPLEVAAIYEAGLQGKDLTQAVAPTGVRPVFSVQPQGRTVFVGDSYVLSAVIAGSQPFTYQWNKNGQPIPGATQASLKLSKMTAADSGSYTLTVSNSVGDTTSSEAVIRVETPVNIMSGLAGHWKFDETSGLTLRDSTTHANHGTLGNFPNDDSQWVGGQIGGALNFRGPSSQDHVVVPDYPKPFGTMALSIWVWTDVQPSDWAMIVNDWSGSCGQFHVGLFGGVDISNFTADGACAAVLTRENTPFPVGSWQHFAFVADGTTMRLYRNGQQVSAAQYSGTIYQPTVTSFGIGMKPNADGSGPGAFFWQGKMDDLGIWTRSLSPEEVMAIYQAGLVGKDLTQAQAEQEVSLTVSISGKDIIISWPVAVSGYALQSSATLTANATWSPVSGVVNNRITLSPANATQFYRLAK